MLWTIENTHSGELLGNYEAETEAGALEAFARDAGWQPHLLATGPLRVLPATDPLVHELLLREDAEA